MEEVQPHPTPEEPDFAEWLEHIFPGFLGKSLVAGGTLMFAMLVGPWVVFWTGPYDVSRVRAHQQIWLLPHIGPVPHLIQVGLLVHWLTAWEPSFLLPALELPGVILLVALLFVIVFPVSFWPTRNVRASAYNVMSFAAIYAALIAVFATVYLQLTHNYRGCFNHRLTHVEALYFTITTFTTTGFGDITAKSPGCRLIVALQTLVALVVITLAIAALVVRLMRQHSDDHSL